MIRLTLLPLLVAGDLAQVSTLCDDLIEGLNYKCVEDIAARPVVAPLVETLQMLNAGQGLGFQVFGVVVDRKMLFRIATTMVGALATGIPIVFGMRPDLNQEFTQNTTDSMQGQLQRMHDQLLQTQQQQFEALQQQLAEQQQLLMVLANRTH